MKKTVYLSMPGYGPIAAGAARGFFRSSNGVNLEPNLNYAHGSLLAQNFNAHWCWALNAAMEGKQVDYFAMLHSDVQPQDFWLDVLVAELEKHNLDVLSALVPIKDAHGVTSTALGKSGAAFDRWSVACRITMQEAYRLPTTFTAEDLGHPDKPLLINTGCWVCKFNPEWAKPPFHFEVNDRIVFCERRKCYVSEVEPEDWNISRRFHSLGLRVGATRKVALLHRGEMNFANTHAWGDYPYDKEYTDHSLFPQAETADPETNGVGWKFPHDVDGWLSETEGRELAKLAKGKHVLEIGSYCGRSTICMAQTAASVMAVDPFDGRGTPRKKNTRDEFHSNLEHYDVADRVFVEPGTIDEIGPTLLNDLADEFDLIFIDGAHDVEFVRNDIQWALRLLGEGGVIAFHDYRRFGDEGVTEAVDEFLADGAELLAVHDTLAIIKPALVLT